MTRRATTATSAWRSGLEATVGNSIREQSSGRILGAVHVETSLRVSHVGDAEPGAVGLGGAWVGECDVDMCECPPVGVAVDPFLTVDLPDDAGADGDGGMTGDAAGVPVALPVVQRPSLVDDALPQ